MKYLGSKNSIAKHIVPIILEKAQQNGITTWVEPFVGGANMIDKVPSHFKRIGYDINPHTIAALIGVRDFINELPQKITYENYQSLKGTKPDPITSLIRFGASFGGKFECGFARDKKADNDPKKRDYWQETVRNAQKQSPLLQNIELNVGSYADCSQFENCLIYCDPPYEGTTSYKTDKFNHSDFWEWVRQMSKSNLVFVSEYNAPDDFECVWQMEKKVNFASQRSEATATNVEKLFILK